MLPDRSLRYAGVDGDIPRLALTSAWQLALIALLVTLLLVLIFPRRALVESLYQQDNLDPLTLSYIQNLYRAEPGNADVALLLARTQRGQMSVAELEVSLLPLTQQASARLRREAAQLLWEAYLQAFERATRSPERNALVARMQTLVNRVPEAPLSQGTLQDMAAQAFQQNQPELGLRILALSPQESHQHALAHYGDLALQQGQHGLAATYYFLARERATTREEARRLFRQGMQAYMAASQYSLALQAAREHIGDLADDRPTLRMMARLALAAGDPAEAARYARRLVFVPGTEGAKP